MKKIILYMILLICSLSLVACGKEKDNDGQNLEASSNNTITFISNGESIGTTSITNYTLPTPTYAGHVFKGWYTDSSCTQKFEESTELVESITLYAKWEVVIVTFKVDSTIYSTVSYDSTGITLPSDPVKEGYDFIGWYMDSAYTTMFSSTMSISENITLYARFINGTNIEFTNSSCTTVTGTSYDVITKQLSIDTTGTYVITGNSTEASILVNKAAKNSIIVIKNLTLTSTTTAPINMKGDCTIVVLGENTLTDVDREQAKPKACLNTGNELVISGAGTLNVNGNNKNGIKADDTLIIDGATVNVTSVDNGIASDNELIINSGNINVNSQGDALKADPDEITDDTQGNVIINGGNIKLISSLDGIQALNDVTINDGSIDIKTGSGYNGTASDESLKGIKGTEGIYIYGGTFAINSTDDAVHSNNYVVIEGGKFEIYTGDDGMHADTSLVVGSEEETCIVDIDIKKSYEGLEAGTVYLYDGNISIVASDDGINAAGGSDGDTGNDNFNPGGGRPGPGRMSSTTTTSSYAIYIHGGNILVNASGDGLDSNGDIVMTGGYVIVLGPTSNADAALDFDGKFTFVGGTVLAIGSSGMAQSPTTGNCVKFTLSNNSISNGSKIEIKDASGNILITYTGLKTANSVVYASNDLNSGSTYYIYINGSQKGSARSQ